jgi:putative methionine-R-sulfoxide reductase with GAF domain
MDVVHEAAVDATVASLHAEHPPFDWVGVYWVLGEDLILGPFRGAPTEHVRIRIPEGVCGSVAETGVTEVVPDVRARPGHIACDLRTRSEVVAPIVRDGSVIGVLDVDSNTPDAFGPVEIAEIEAAAARIAAGH